jgi:hypothetical protein
MIEFILGYYVVLLAVPLRPVPLLYVARRDPDTQGRRGTAEGDRAPVGQREMNDLEKFVAEIMGGFEQVVDTASLGAVVTTKPQPIAPATYDAILESLAQFERIYDQNYPRILRVSSKIAGLLRDRVPIAPAGTPPDRLRGIPLVEDLLMPDNMAFEVPLHDRDLRPDRVKVWVVEGI